MTTAIGNRLQFRIAGDGKKHSRETKIIIAGRRFTERTNAVTDVKIYSNARKVELLLNGISQGRRSDGTNCIFVWNDVRLSPGENRIKARAERDGENLSDSCNWGLKKNAVI
jgi:beta-galactosidase